MTGYYAPQEHLFARPKTDSSYAHGFITGAPKALLRLEGALALAAALTAYTHLGLDWKLFALLFLVPDLSMLGYIAGPAKGAIAYNLAHTYALAFVFGAFGFWLTQPLFAAFSLILIAHIGFDRMLGYGLKYPAGFEDTHLGKIGKSITVSSSSVR